MKKQIKHFLKNDSGATALEYGVMIALISLMAAPILTQIGETLGGVFETVALKMSAKEQNASFRVLFSRDAALD